MRFSRRAAQRTLFKTNCTNDYMREKYIYIYIHMHPYSLDALLFVPYRCDQSKYIRWGEEEGDEKKQVTTVVEKYERLER